MDIVALIAETPATEEQIDIFKAELRVYDEAIIRALMANEKRLAAIDSDLNAMLADAYVLEDGRRVFKNSDGETVIDEFNQPVSPDEIDPDFIPDHLPAGELFSAAWQERLDAQEERAATLALQEMHDEALAYADSGDATVEGIEERLEAMSEAAPDAVKREMGLEVTPRTEAVPTPDVNANRGPILEMPAL